MSRALLCGLLLVGGAAIAAPPDLGVGPNGESQPETQRVKKRVRDGEPPSGAEKDQPKEPAESRKVDE